VWCRRAKRDRGGDLFSPLHGCHCRGMASDARRICQHATVSPLYPPIEAFVSGALDVGEGHTISWEMSGNLSGAAALVLHGGPGSGRAVSARRYFDPTKYRVVATRSKNRATELPG
jgi:hypothetical protein